MSGRIAGATDAIRKAIATVTEMPIERIAADDDLVDDLCLDELEREGLGLIVEEVFGVIIDDALWDSPLYRTPEALAEWVIRQADIAAEAELQRQRRRA